MNKKLITIILTLAMMLALVITPMAAETDIPSSAGPVGISIPVQDIEPGEYFSFDAYAYYTADGREITEQEYNELSKERGVNPYIVRATVHGLWTGVYLTQCGITVTSTAPNINDLWGSYIVYDKTGGGAELIEENTFFNRQPIGSMTSATLTLPSVFVDITVEALYVEVPVTVQTITRQHYLTPVRGFNKRT